MTRRYATILASAILLLGLVATPRVAAAQKAGGVMKDYFFQEMGVGRGAHADQHRRHDELAREVARRLKSSIRSGLHDGDQLAIRIVPYSRRDCREIVADARAHLRKP